MSNYWFSKTLSPPNRDMSQLPSYGKFSALKISIPHCPVKIHNGFLNSLVTIDIGRAIADRVGYSHGD